MRWNLALGSPIFRKFLLSAFLLLAVALLLLDLYLTRYTTARETDSIERRLTAEARILASEAAAVPSGEFRSFAADADRRAQARVTIIDPAGVVLADSQQGSESMENHAGRPEIQEAMKGRIGISIRHSATLDRDFCYAALAFTYREKPGYVLRLALPLESLDEALAEVHRRIFVASASTAGLALLVAYFFSSRISRRIRRLQAFAEQLMRSREVEVLYPEANDELGALSRALNRMASRQGDLIDTLRVESSRRQAILTSMVDGVLAVDEHMRVMFCNDSFAKAIGGGAPPSERFPLLSLVRDAALVDVLTKVLASGQPLKRRVQLPVTGDRVFEIQATPLVSTQRDGAIAILHEITEIERLERVRKDFVANVSHELRTPLTAIQGCAEVLLDGALDDPEVNRKFVETITAHASRLSSISADLLTLSELDAGAAAPVCPVSLKNSILSAVRTVEAEARLRGINLVCDAIEDIEIHGHQLRLEQAFVNLLDNAIKFNHAGGEVRVAAARTSGEIARVSFSDTGIGIPTQDLSRIFERFYRVDKARSRQVGGTGLGLAIVKHTIELMGGRVEVNSELGNGSIFTVVLPALSPPLRIG